MAKPYVVVEFVNEGGAVGVVHESWIQVDKKKKVSTVSEW